ncbi:hypothetical protein PGIGA_G00126150 [Pangasianodon gigas]|uniref:Uncharacterized protein n=1 Tax=Pangasianodon gigas TaxID=30993 RepID=A0ACC5XHU5_PANGG|nr:hypothetical protein [Pangasianodon gigas]
MSMVVKAAEVECRGPLSKSGVRQPPIRAFMDDLTITTTSVPGCRWILQGLESLITWARMSFKASKSRSMGLKRGKVIDKFRFSILGIAIPSITEQPVKSLGKFFDSTLKDTTAIQKFSEELGAWLTKVDKSGLPGRFKAWIYQHSILPRVLWPLLVYAVPLTTVESLERKISGFLRKWLGLPRSLTSAALYGTNNTLQLPFSGLTEEFKVARTREALQYRDSRDHKVSSAGIEVRTGRKWKAEKAVEVAESRLRQKALVGTLATGRAGLAYVPKIQVSKARGKERHQLLQEEVRAGLEEERVGRAVGLRQQGAWTRWESALQRKVTWSNIMQADFHRVRFLCQKLGIEVLCMQSKTKSSSKFFFMNRLRGKKNSSIKVLQDTSNTLKTSQRQTAQKCVSADMLGDESFLDMLSHLQGNRMDDQRCSIQKELGFQSTATTNPSSSCSSLPKNMKKSFSESAVSQGQDAFLRVLDTAQSRRLEDQGTVGSVPVLCNFQTNQNSSRQTVLSQLMTNADISEPDDHFFDMLMKSQGSRLNDQRCAPPPALIHGPTVPDEDFFSLIVRSQAKRMNEQRVTLPSKN